MVLACLKHEVLKWLPWIENSKSPANLIPVQREVQQSHQSIVLVEWVVDGHGTEQPQKLIRLIHRM